MSRSERIKPTLPQHDTPSGRATRKEAIAKAHATYQWTTEVSTLPGVPLAAAVPSADRPSVPWLLNAVRAALPVARNTLAGSGLSFDGEDPAQHLDGIEFALEDVEQEHMAAAEPTAAFGMGEIFDAAVQAASKLVQRHDAKLWDQLDELKKLTEQERESTSKGLELDDYAQLFHTLDLPAVAQVFTDDATFARMRVAGPNPMLLTRATADNLGFPLSDATLQSALGPAESVKQALAEERLFQLNYEGLAGIVPGSTDGIRQYLWRPIAIFGVARGSGELRPLAIKLDQADVATIVTAPPAGTPTNYAWEMAKFGVQVADGNYHELFVHLARTHLVQEAFTLATYRSLAPNHPIAVLLLPHFQGTLFINSNAAGSLIAAGGAIDRIFAGTINSIQSATVANRLDFDFSASLLPRDLKRRGVDDAAVLKDFPYRDDGLLIWNALAAWTKAYVETYYASDTDIVADTELATWSAELIGHGKMHGFTAPQTRSELSDILTMVIFTGSAQHAAVNFPQRSLMSYAPSFTGSAWSDIQGTAQTHWIDMMPPLDRAAQQLQTLWFLGSLYFTQLGRYKEASFPYGDWFLDEAITRPGGPLEALEKTLDKAETIIKGRNTTRSLPYDYFLPSKIPQSINI